jgi:hypothetical protein
MTYLEMQLAQENDTLKLKVRSAVLVAADAIRSEAPATTNHVARVAWAKAAFSNPQATSATMMGAVLAQNVAATLAVVLAASDATIQTAVNAAVDVLT